MQELAYINGKIMQIEKAVTSIDDRGYNFGDAVYEYIEVCNGALFCVKEHLDRLERSLKELSFPAMSRDMIEKAIYELAEQSGIKNAGIYIQISRGVAGRIHQFPDVCEPKFVMTIKNAHEILPEIREKGATAITVEDIRWGRCDIKTVQLLPNVLAKQKALDKGAFDAIFISKDDIAREATSSNLFIDKNGIVMTHPLTNAILPGITRAQIIDICRELKIPVAEVFFDSKALFEADEVFLTGTTTEVLSIVKVDGEKIGQGRVGEISKELFKELGKRMGRL